MHPEVRVRQFRNGPVIIGIVDDPPALAGMIAIPRWDAIKLAAKSGDHHYYKNLDSEKKWRLVESIYHALRLQYHILAQYGNLDLSSGERKVLAFAGRSFELLNEVMISLPPGVSPKHVRKLVEQIALDAAKALGKPSNINKQRAQKRARALSSGTDSLNRVNPMAGAARAWGGYHDVDLRMEQILAIDPNIHGRHRALASLINITKIRLQACKRCVDRLLAKDTFAELVHNTAGNDITAAHLESFAEKLEAVDFRPYVLMCRLTAADLHTAAKLLRRSVLRSSDVKKLRHVLCRCQFALELKAEQIRLERLIYQLTRYQHGAINRLPRREIEDQLRRIDALITRRTPFRLVHPIPPSTRDSIVAARAHVRKKHPNFRTLKDNLKKISRVL